MGASLGPCPTQFGDQCTAEKLIMVDEDGEGMNDEPCALLMLDRGTDYVDVFTLKAKTADECHRCFLEFAGPHDYIKELFTDNAPELIKAAETAQWINSTSTPGRPQSNGVAERTVRSVKEGARTILLVAGLTPKFWPLALRHWCFSRNTRKRRTGKPVALPFTNAFCLRNRNHAFSGQKVRFGAPIDFRQSPAKD